MNDMVKDHEMPVNPEQATATPAGRETVNTAPTNVEVENAMKVTICMTKMKNSMTLALRTTTPTLTTPHHLNRSVVKGVSLLNVAHLGTLGGGSACSAAPSLNTPLET
jgi:hypothetical protein